MKKLLALLMMVILPMIAGCGGDDGTFIPINAYTSAVLKLSAKGNPNPPAGTKTRGFVVSMQLPAGVTVKTGANNVVDASVIVPSGVYATNSTLGAIIYTPAAGATKATLEFSLASNSAAGVDVIGEYVTVNFTLAGAAPTAADLVVTKFDVADLNANPIANLTADKAVTLK